MNANPADNPAVACREFLAGALAMRGALSPELEAHRAACASCAERLARGLHFARLIAAVPALPDALGAADLRERIHERAVELAEASPLGATLAAGMAAVPAPEAWPEPVVETELGHLVRTPQLPSTATWARVGLAIRADLAAAVRGGQVSRRRVGGWLVGGMGAAAAAAVFLLLAREEPRQAPNIVFADLEQPPGVEFTVLRYGALR
jgi:hypothetical protein